MSDFRPRLKALIPESIAEEVATTSGSSLDGPVREGAAAGGGPAAP